MNGKEAFPWVPLLERQLRNRGAEDLVGKDVYIASDYSGTAPGSQYYLIGVLMIDLENSRDWPTMRTEVRRRFLADGRRMAFKNLNDGNRRAALVPFLEAAENLKGTCLVLAVDNRTRNFGGFEGIRSESENRGLLTWKWKDQSFRRMVDITHVISALISFFCKSGQNVYWISDHDDCFASDAHTEDTRRMIGRFCTMHVHFELGQLALGTTMLDEGDRFEEDLASIPDLAVGGLCETLHKLHSEYGKVPDIETEIPELSTKNSVIHDWFFYESELLRKIACFVQPGPNRSIQLGSLRQQIRNGS